MLPCDVAADMHWLVEKLSGPCVHRNFMSVDLENAMQKLTFMYSVSYNA